MQVKIEFQRFEGVADIPAGDLETFIRVMRKLQEVDSRYVGLYGEYPGGSVNVLQAGKTPEVKAEVIIGQLVVTQDVYNGMIKQKEAHDAEVERKNAAKLATLVNDLIYVQNPEEAAVAEKALLDELANQSRLCYKEANNCTVAGADTDNGVTLHVVDHSGDFRTLTITTLGQFKAVKGHIFPAE